MLRFIVWGDRRKPTLYLETVRVDLPKETLDFLVNLPLPVEAQRDEKHNQQENCQDDCSYLCRSPRRGTLISIVAAVRLVHGLVVARPVNVDLE